jgi:hypothetical protein
LHDNPQFFDENFGEAGINAHISRIISPHETEDAARNRVLKRIAYKLLNNHTLLKEATGVNSANKQRSVNSENIDRFATTSSAFLLDLILSTLCASDEDLPARIDPGTFLCPALSKAPLHVKKMGAPAYALAFGNFTYISPDVLAGDGILNESGCMMPHCGDTCEDVCVNMCGHTMCSDCREKAVEDGQGCPLSYAAEVEAITETAQQRIAQLHAPISMATPEGTSGGVGGRPDDGGDSDSDEGDNKGDPGADFDAFLESATEEDVKRQSSDKDVAAKIIGIREKVLQAAEKRAKKKKGKGRL